MSDNLTILRSRGLPLCKTFRADGSVQSYSNARWFTSETAPVGDIHDLSALLTRLESETTATIIRGAPKGDVAQPLRRLIENLDDIPLHAILIEVDSFRPLVSDPVLEPEESAVEFIGEHLPSAFHKASFHWQLSNSAGAPGKEGVLKAHIWFWLATPYDSYTLRAWAKAEVPGADRSVFQPSQPHYTAAPIFEDGVEDPVPRRSGFHQGEHDAVDLTIDTAALDIRAKGARQRGARLDMDDPRAAWLDTHWETWGVLANGGLSVTCPFEDEHSSGASGDTSTAYFPAGTSGYAEGRWVCLHTTCSERRQAEFDIKCGYADNTFEALAETAPTGAVNGHAVNGRAVDESLAPWFQRDSVGKMLISMTNAAQALRYPHFSGTRLRYDTFKDGIVCAPHKTEAWRPFTDVDYTNLRIVLENKDLPGIGREMIRDAVHLVAAENAFDTAIDWINTLEWDGVPRVEDFWIRYFGVQRDNHGYAQAVGRYTWTALAGRVLNPGVQADMVPMLVGRQGAGKSRGVAAISPSRDFATTMSFNEPEVDRARKMRGKVVIELAELQGLRSREREEIKAWITRSDEHWTPKFMEMSTVFKRRAILFATTNDHDQLDDPTGERRWLPLEIGDVDTLGIVADRDQLWAEAKVRYMAFGIEWADAEDLAATQHDRYRTEDPWRGAIERWLEQPDMSGDRPSGRKWLLAHEVAEGALSMALRSLKDHETRRIGKVLRSLGYDNKIPVKVDGKSVKVWRRV